MNIRALIDHPWPLHQTFDARSNAFRVLTDFLELTLKHGLEPAAFVTVAEYSAAIPLISHRLGHDAVASWHRIIRKLIAEEATADAATIRPEVHPLADTWRQALHREMSGRDWRCPQIVVAPSRRARWPATDFVAVQFIAGGVSTTEDVVLVGLSTDEYSSHPYAVPDGNPWDTRHCAAISLPCPPQVRQPGLDAIRPQLPPSGEIPSADRYCFVPPPTWSPNSQSRADWRLGRGFERRSSWNQKGTGPIDVHGRVWVFDTDHPTHWDVQPADRHDVRKMDAEYWRVLPDGSRQRRD